MSSSRLPGKALKPLYGRPMVTWLMERLQRCRTVDVVCLATSSQDDDDPLERTANDAGIECYRGPLDDVLGRVLGAAKSVEADLIVEMTGDCPLADPAIVDAAVERYLRGGYDYLINLLDGFTFPNGFDIQVYSVELLEEVSRLANDPQDRVDVTPYIYHNADRYRCLNLLAPEALDRPRYRLCVDHEEDFEAVSRIFEALHPAKPEFNAFDIVRFLDERPDLASMNTNGEDAYLHPSSRGGHVDREVLQVEER